VLFNYSSDLRMRLRKEIVKFKYFPDCIREFDTHTFCKYINNDIIVDLYEDTILFTVNNNIEKLSYANSNIDYINTILGLYHENSKKE